MCICVCVCREMFEEGEVEGCLEIEKASVLSIYFTSNFFFLFYITRSK